MKTVFIVERCIMHEGSGIIGVFLSSRKAEKYQAKKEKTNNDSDIWYSLIEYTLDEEAK